MIVCVVDGARLAAPAAHHPPHIQSKAIPVFVSLITKPSLHATTEKACLTKLSYKSATSSKYATLAHGYIYSSGQAL